MFLPLLEKRRSIRKFKDKPVEQDKVDQLIEAALRSPSSMGKNPWRFIMITDRQRMKKLAAAKQHGSAFAKYAPLIIVICADSDLSDVWIEDAAIAAIILHLTAQSLGLGSCWIQIRNRMHDETTSSQDYLSELLKLPKNMKVLAMVAVGYPDEEKSPHRKEDLQFEKIYTEFYGIPLSSSK